MPGSTSLALRRPFALAIGIVAAPVVVIVLGVVVWVFASEWVEERGRAERPTAADDEPYVSQTLVVKGNRGSIYGSGPEGVVSKDEGRLLLYAHHAFDAHPEGGCRLGEVGLRDGSCGARTTAAFEQRVRKLEGVSRTALLSRSVASQTHEVTLLAFRQDGDVHVLNLSVVDDGGRLYGVEVVLVDLEPAADVLAPTIDDVRCTGRPETSVYLATRYDPSG